MPAFRLRCQGTSWRRPTRRPAVPIAERRGPAAAASRRVAQAPARGRHRWSIPSATDASSRPAHWPTHDGALPVDHAGCAILISDPLWGSSRPPRSRSAPGGRTRGAPALCARGAETGRRQADPRRQRAAADQLTQPPGPAGQPTPPGVPARGGVPPPRTHPTQLTRARRRAAPSGGATLPPGRTSWRYPRPVHCRCRPVGVPHLRRPPRTPSAGCRCGGERAGVV